MALFRRQRNGDVVIDLAAAERAERMRPARPEQMWGLPSRCPSCSEPGYLDRIDPVHEVMYQHCPSCFHKWETTRAEIETRADSTV